jgi:uncharacterized protein Yka (UPF0111/DUF47 family)
MSLLNPDQSEQLTSREEEPLVKRSIDFIFQALLPKDKLFYPLFDQACNNLVETAQVLEKALKSDSVTRIQSFETINLLEKQGDEITHAIMRETGNTFIVPFDREDIHALAIAIDDVVDYIYGTSKRLDIYKVHQIRIFYLIHTPNFAPKNADVDQAFLNLNQSIHLVKSYFWETRVDKRRLEITLIKMEAAVPIGFQSNSV